MNCAIELCNRLVAELVNLLQMGIYGDIEKGKDRINSNDILKNHVPESNKTRSEQETKEEKGFIHEEYGKKSVCLFSLPFASSLDEQDFNDGRRGEGGKYPYWRNGFQGRGEVRGEGEFMEERRTLPFPSLSWSQDQDRERSFCDCFGKHEPDRDGTAEHDFVQPG